jgi:UDP-N-acetyl-2-amino-2-deoxyglucuronate dehydrogenase
VSAPPEIRLAIVGAGMVARYHAQAIKAAPGARLVATCRSDPARTAAAEAEFGVPCETAYDALLARPDVDAVCICTPSGAHAAQTIAAARAGKHVLVEKPMALTLSDADAMIEACHGAGVRLGVALQRRTEPAYQAVRGAIAGGALGRPVMGLALVPYFRGQAYYDSAAWRGTWAEDGGGALMNQGIHIVDLLLWFMGDVDEVQACADTLTHSIEVEDAVTASLRFKNGALGSIVATTAASPGFPHRVEVYGTRGGVQLEAESVVRWDSDNPPTLPASLAPGSAGAGAGSSPTGLAPTGHARIVADFVGSVRDGQPPLVPGEEGRRSLSLVLAVYEAVRSGRPVRPDPGRP